MASQLDLRAAELGRHVQKILKQFQAVHACHACEPEMALNHQELRVVEFLGSGGNQIMRAIAEHLSLAVNSVTTVVDGLENKGYVQRHRSDADRRVIYVELTETGQTAWKAVEQSKLELYRAMLGPLSPDEQKTFLSLFGKIAQVGSAVTVH
ncbi:MarR family winged helix-turn-helix transcriptional regulator [Planctomicrobium piriforme]|uniref:MarR family transcriptional regulator, 2-MHQ and catechol-resistance regulon repressor n=1 Tax=Planctomicrobium piriforme TaxID=1576369 RepID=A0A1I3FXW6_9PLAN|nr:MarR family transcriptional regulator [Planctomicrobium piriforme]SFI16035.1 MarR family transcriptional regulator, 2-MHQ and catechol-resistance regulon repressor [Planctomicrobium piriforme]